MADTDAFDAAVKEAVQVEKPEQAVDSVELCSEQIRVRKMATWTLLSFAKMATRDIGTKDMAGMAALYDIAVDSVHPEALARFEQLMVEKRVNGDQLMEFVTAAIAKTTGHPTEPSSSSPQSASPDLLKSKSGSVVDLGDGLIVERQPGETTAQTTRRALELQRAQEDLELEGIEKVTEIEE